LPQIIYLNLIDIKRVIKAINDYCLIFQKA